MSLDLDLIRQQFPSLNRPAIFFDNPGGTQICRTSAARIQRYFMECNANHGGAFQTSRDSDALVAETRQAMADFLNAARPEEIVIGPNMRVSGVGGWRDFTPTTRSGCPRPE